MRTFSNIHVGSGLSFAFEGHHFFFDSLADEPGMDELLLGGLDINLSFYKTDKWKKHFQITDEEWAAFEQQFYVRLDQMRDAIVADVVVRAEQRRKREEKERLEAIERELRRSERRQTLDIDEVEIDVVERPGQWFLDLPNRKYWNPNVSRPITKALHDMLVSEIGVLSPETSDEDEWTEDDED